MASVMNSNKHLKNINSSQTFPKSEEEGTLPNSLYESSITLITSQTKTLQEKKITDQYHWWI